MPPYFELHIVTNIAPLQLLIPRPQDKYKMDVSLHT